MLRRRDGFTLVELVVVLTIVGVLAAILFPVFRSIKEKAKQTVWIEAQRQLGMATQMYLVDYEERYMIAQYRPLSGADPTTDRTWVQSLLPYVRDFQSFVCPADDSRDSASGVLDSSIVAGDTYARYYRASMRSNSGYNYLYFAPIVYENGWVSKPRSSSEIVDPNRTITMGDSAWEVIDGRAKGGGNFLVVPPCRYEAGRFFGLQVDSFGLGNIPANEIFTPMNIWQSQSHAVNENILGGLYPWFFKRITVINAQGGAQSYQVSDIVRGCDVRPRWNGMITNNVDYLWDIR